MRPKPELGPVKRYSIDLPVDLHRRMKIACAERGVLLYVMVLELLEREFPPPRKPRGATPAFERPRPSAET
jgi:hypothetical protein